jgi:hypothetical protein
MTNCSIFYFLLDRDDDDDNENEKPAQVQPKNVERTFARSSFLLLSNYMPEGREKKTPPPMMQFLYTFTSRDIDNDGGDCCAEQEGRASE